MLLAKVRCTEKYIAWESMLQGGNTLYEEVHCIKKYVARRRYAAERNMLQGGGTLHEKEVCCARKKYAVGKKYIARKDTLREEVCYTKKKYDT